MNSRAPNNGGQKCLDLCHAMSSAQISLTPHHMGYLLAPLSSQLKYVNIFGYYIFVQILKLMTNKMLHSKLSDLRLLTNF